MTRIRLWTVSYTHLDVYKRQDVKLVDDVKLPIKFYTDSNGKPCMEDAAGKVTELYTIRDFITVSYTHLDVYKRQELYRL